MTRYIRRLLGGCDHGRPQHTYCAACLRRVSDEAAAVSK